MDLAVHDGSGGGDWHQEISWTLYEDNVKYLSGLAPYLRHFVFRTNPRHTSSK